MDASQHFKVGNKEVVKVLQLDAIRGHIDLSKRRVTAEERETCKRRYKKTKLVRQILDAVSEKVSIDREILYLYINLHPHPTAI